MINLPHAAFTLLGIVISGCVGGVKATTGTPVDISVVGSSIQCRADTAPGVRVLPEGANVGALLGRAQAHDQHAEQRMIVVSMGQRATAGYGLALASSQAFVANGVLTITVKWQEPPAGSLQAQILTHPCLVVAVPKGEFTRIRIIDESAKERFSATLR